MAGDELDLSGVLPLVAWGKVRQLYDLPDLNDDTTARSTGTGNKGGKEGDEGREGKEGRLLFVASDRISAYDVVLGSLIPDKGRVLTMLSKHWFSELSKAIPNLKHHFITSDLPPQISTSGGSGDETGLGLQRRQRLLADRCMQVRRLRIVPIEAIVRGYITGSAWSEYCKSGTVHGIAMPTGLRESEAFPQGPIYTPSTKAEQGEHDENISPEQAAAIIGDPAVAERIQSLAIQLYTVARDLAREKGIIIADTKFEFGLDEHGDVVLADEVLTPDSSRFWAADKYRIGSPQQSFDKQYLRDWLTQQGLKGKATELPQDVVEQTAAKYKEAYTMLTGLEFKSSYD